MLFNFVREGASPLRASFVIFSRRASRARKILTRTIHNDKKYDCEYDKNMSVNMIARTRIFRAGEARPRKITSEAQNAKRFVHFTLSLLTSQHHFQIYEQS